MRPGGSFNVTSSPAQPQRSPWHSPVPYLFGGLAAMLGLIAFALLILACSYWKLSGYLDGENNNANGDSNGEDVESGKSENLKPPQEIEEKILVIMAGQIKPTFLATPISSRSSSFGDNSSCSSSEANEKSLKSEETKVKLESGNNQVLEGYAENHVASAQVQ